MREVLRETSLFRMLIKFSSQLNIIKDDQCAFTCRLNGEIHSKRLSSLEYEHQREEKSDGFRSTFDIIHILFRVEKRLANNTCLISSLLVCLQGRKNISS